MGIILLQVALTFLGLIAGIAAALWARMSLRKNIETRKLVETLAALIPRVAPRVAPAPPLVQGTGGSALPALMYDDGIRITFEQIPAVTSSSEAPDDGGKVAGYIANIYLGPTVLARVDAIGGRDARHKTIVEAVKKGIHVLRERRNNASVPYVKTNAHEEDDESVVIDGRGSGDDEPPEGAA